MADKKYRFDNTYELEKILEDDIPDVQRTGTVYAQPPNSSDLDTVPWRDPLYTVEEEPELVGEVSSNDDWYHVTQFEDVVQAPLDRLKDRGEDPSGHVNLSNNKHKLTAKLQLSEDFQIEPQPGDIIATELHVRAGHTGAIGIRYTSGATRLECSNGMTSLVDEQIYEQTHSKPFKPQLGYQAVDAILDGTEEVEKRLQEAQEQELMNQDEALLILRDQIGIDFLLDQPVPDMIIALDEEVEDKNNPTLYETYNAATYAIEHLASDNTPEHLLDSARQNAADLIEQNGAVPDAKRLGRTAVNQRSNRLLESETQEDEEYWQGETEVIRDLREAHEITS